MEELTLTEIAPYLPYGLTALRQNKIFNDDKFYKIIGADLQHVYYAYVAGYKIEHSKPILCPLNLTTPIIVEGKEIIPIVELAKIAFPDKNWRKPNGIFYYPTARTGYPEVTYDFVYNHGFKAVRDIHHFDKQDVYVPNQLALFQWLFKHKYDVFGLIDKGLAIDVNTLEVNPYA